MLRTLVLRFSDLHTVPDHESVLSDLGHVWWGWWAKPWEPLNHGRLRAARLLVQGGRSLRIALVNRKDEEFFAAECTSVVFKEKAEDYTTTSPEPTATPEYYRTAELRAWFKFASIERISRRDYDREFGDYPVGDPTLYGVISSPSGLSLEPSPNWSLRSVGAPGDGVLHLSCLHFGSMHGYALPNGAQFRPGLPTLLDRILEGLTESSVSIGMVVVSGDFVSDGNPEGFPLALDFLRSLRRALGLGEQHLVVVPGDDDFHKLVPGGNPKIYYQHERDYRSFVRDLYERDVRDLEELRRFRTASGWDVILLLLNSARLRGENTTRYGYVGAHRYARMLEYAHEGVGAFDVEQRRLAMAVMHHHLCSVYPEDDVTIEELDERSAVNHRARGVGIALDAGQIANALQASGVWGVLHGHQHLPFLGYESRAVFEGGGWQSWRDVARGLYVLGAGSAGCSREHLSEILPLNSFNVYNLSNDALQVSTLGYGPRERPRLLLGEELQWSPGLDR